MLRGSCSALFIVLLSILSFLYLPCSALRDLAEAASVNPSQDFYDDVSEKEWKNWEADGLLKEGASIAQLADSIDSLWPVRVNVRCVGWSGALLVQLRSANMPDIKVHGRPVGASDTQSNALMQRAPLRVTYSHAPQLLAKLQAARDAQLSKSNLRNAEIDPAAIETILHEEYTSLAPMERVWTLYLLNLSRPADGAYVYASEPCAAPMMVSASERFAWLDQAAGPCEWGPVVAGFGYVDSRHLPLTADPALADVVAFVHRTASLLLAPSVHAQPKWALVPQPLLVRLLLVRSAGININEPPPWSVLSYSNALKDAAPDEGSVRVESRTVSLSDWPAASAALASSIRTRTSAYHSDDQLKVTVHPYLDSALLGDALRPVLNAFDPPPPTGVRVLRAILFDIGGAEALLLDRLHQALALIPDLVIAVQTNVSRLSLDYRCGRRSLQLDARNASRALLGAVLSAAYGVAPSHKHFRGQGNDDEALEWSVGRSLYGPFSAFTGVTPTLADAAHRTFVLQLVNASATRVKNLGNEPDLDLPPSELLSPSKALQLQRRLLLLRFIWISAAQAQEFHRHSATMALVRAADSEAYRIERLSLAAAAARRAQLSCPSPRVFAIDTALLILSVLLMACGSGCFFATRLRSQFAANAASNKR